MKKLIFIILMLILSGCIDSVIHLKGKVISNITDEPIAGAKVKLKSKNIIVTTDSLGRFELNCHSGRGLFTKSKFFITKEGYKDFEIELDNENLQRIYKVSSETYYYDFKGGKHLCPDTISSSNIWLACISFEKYSTDFSIKKDSLIIYLDVDIGTEGEFENYLKEHKNHKFKIIDK